MFPGAHPMRRVLTRLIVTDANGDKTGIRQGQRYVRIQGRDQPAGGSRGNTIKPGFETVDVKYDKHGDVVIQGYTPDFNGKKHVSSQYMDQTKVDWVSPDGTVSNSAPVCTDIDPDTGDCIGSWVIKGTTTVKKIYRYRRLRLTTSPVSTVVRQASVQPDGTHVVRPGFDSNIAAITVSSRTKWSSTP